MGLDFLNESLGFVSCLEETQGRSTGDLTWGAFRKDFINGEPRIAILQGEKCLKDFNSVLLWLLTNKYSPQAKIVHSFDISLPSNHVKRPEVPCPGGPLVAQGWEM